MGDSQEKQGLFAVRLSMKNGVPVAVLTGDHFGAESASVARAVSRAESRNAMLSGESPVYLVKDAVVRLAVNARRRALIDGLSSCHSGDKGKPCGKCEICAAAEDAAFTRIVLGSMEAIKGFEHLRTALSSVIGSTWVDAPWDVGMTEEEVEEVLEEMNVITKEG